MARRSRCLVVTAVITLLLMAGTGWAQTRSELTGTVKDSTGAVLPGVTVTLTSPNLVGGAQTHVTNAAGVYRFADLPLGTYELDASLQGFQTVKRTGLRVAFGTTVTIDLVLPIGGVAETVIVSGATPVIDVKTAASTTKIDNDLLQSLPISGRAGRPQEIFAMSPGATTFRTAHGGQRDANNLMVDGMSASIPGGNIRTSLVTYNWMAEVQVVALGANAEYGEFTGTVSNMLMRSGSNRFSGMAEYVFSRPGWLADNRGGLSPTLQARFTPVKYQEDWDLSYQGGGPIVKDKLFFFAGGQYVRNSRNQAGAMPDDNGKVWPTLDTWPRYIGKVNWAASNSVKLEGYLVYDKDQIDSGGNANTAPSAASGSNNPKNLFNTRLTWTLSDKTLVEVRGGFMTFQQNSIPPKRATAPYAHSDSVWGYAWGNTGRAFQDYNRTSVSGTLTRWVDDFVGKSHELKFGVDFEHTKMANGSYLTGGRSYSDQAGKPNQVTLFDGSVTTGFANRLSVYAQDSWSLTDTFTLQPGVRISIDRGSTPGESGLFHTNPVDPRLGFAWDIGGTHKTLLRGHFGRFHDNVSPTMVNFLDFSHWNPSITARVNADGSFTELTRSVMPGSASFDPNLKHSYMDQYTLALEREMFPDFSLTVQVVRRKWDTLFAFVDTNSQWAATQKLDPGPDNVLNTADDGAMIDVFNLLNPGQKVLVFTNPDDAERHYTAFMLIAKKRFSHNWQALVSYTYSKAEGQVTNAGGNTTGSGVDVGQSGQWTNPNVKINAYGPGNFDFPHMFVASATYRVPYLGGANMSVTYRLTSGAPWSRTATIRGLAQGNQTVRIEPRSAHRTDRMNQLDMRIEKTFHLGSPTRTAGVYVDLFNLPNKGYATSMTEASGGTFGLPAGWSGGRQLMLGLRVNF